MKFIWLMAFFDWWVMGRPAGQWLRQEKKTSQSIKWINEWSRRKRNEWNDEWTKQTERMEWSKVCLCEWKEWNGAPSGSAVSEWIKLNFSFSRCARRKVDLMNGGLPLLFNWAGYGWGPSPLPHSNSIPVKLLLPFHFMLLALLLTCPSEERQPFVSSF